MFIGISCIHAWTAMYTGSLFHGGIRGSNPLAGSSESAAHASTPDRCLLPPCRRVLRLIVPSTNRLTVSFECGESVSGRPLDSRDCAQIEPKLHQLLSGTKAVTGIAAEAPPQVQPPNAAYHCSGAGASEGRRAQ